MKKIVYVLIVALLAGVYLGCSDDDSPTKPKPDTVLKVFVNGVDPVNGDTTIVVNSNVVVYDAETNQAVIRDLSDVYGVCSFKLEQGNYFLTVSAQGYDPSPAPNVVSVPFFVSANSTTEQTRMLRANPSGAGYIEGKIVPAVNNMLVIAENTADQSRYDGISGPDGYFVIYNLPSGTYGIESFKAGYKQTSPVSSTLIVGDLTDSVTVSVEKYAGSSLTGSVSFLATSDTLDVDVVLRDPVTKAVIPGLRTREIGSDYTLDSIPDGDFLAWASFENDGYVLDPDWLFKNPDGLDLTFPASGASISFSVTGSVKIVSPTNPADSIYAFMADSVSPTFSWLAYSSAKEYIIEVKDINGNIVWGGFDQNGIVQHQQILKENLSIQYNYDNSGSALVPGQIYQWKIYADNDTALNVQTLISSSEDLMGIFQVPEETVKK